MTSKTTEEPRLDLEHYKDSLSGEDVIVLGLGESTSTVPSQHLRRYWTIGVNDVGRHHNPDFLVLCNSPSCFSSERRDVILDSKVKAAFVFPMFVGQWTTEHGFRVVSCPMSRGIIPGWKDRGVIPNHTTSPYVAIALAAYMGARRVGFLGVDFGPSRFWEQPPEDPKERLWGGTAFEEIDDAYTALAVMLPFTDVVNLSKTSHLTSVPRGRLDMIAPKPSGQETKDKEQHSHGPRHNDDSGDDPAVHLSRR